MIAPLIKPIRVQGGQFYTFSSASEDLSLSFNESQKKFRFSKFALLNIPDITGSSSLGENLMNFSNSPGGFSEIDGAKTLNDYLAESFQNYCLNLEAMVTSSASYDSNIDLSVTERIFYKWLKETGAIRFRNAIVGSEQSSSIYGSHYVEENESLTYSRVVKYVGDINILNTVRNNENTFSEVYIYVPTSHGNTPVVMFKTVADANYSPNYVFTNDPSDPLNREYIYERTGATVQPAGLSIQAFFDSDTNTYTTVDPFGASSNFYYFNNTLNSWIQQGNPGFQWWFSNPIANSYFTEPGSFLDSTNDLFKIESVNKTSEFLRSRLDGISTEFNTAVYAGISTSGGVTDFGTYNTSASSQTFDFNAVLVYYDLYDPSTGTVYATNLFGVLFLDNVDPSATGGGYIPRLTKYKPNSFTGDNGNSYAFRINLKFDVNTQDASVETSINDYNPYSLELYMDALNKMVDAYNILLDNNAVVFDLSTQVQNLQSLILNDATAADLQSQIDAINTNLQNNNAIFTNSSNILALIQRNYEEITNIYKNYTSVQMSYNIDVFAEGRGIFLDKSQAGSVKIVNTNQLFNIGTKPLVSIASDFTSNPSSFSYIHKLDNYTNYLKITDGSANNPYIVDRDVIVYIDDANLAWEKGQAIRFSFKYGLNLSNTNGNFNFVVYTDAADKLNTGFPYSAEAAFVTYLDFQNKGNSPIVEVVCLDPATYQFAIDIY
jgi:hypothetical protein